MKLQQIFVKQPFAEQWATLGEEVICASEIKVAILNLSCNFDGTKVSFLEIVFVALIHLNIRYYSC